MRSADILIVGGGPAGSSCAFHLRRWGLKVLLIDRARFPRLESIRLLSWRLTPAFFARALALSPQPSSIASLALPYCDMPQDDEAYEAVIAALVAARAAFARTELHLPLDTQDDLERLAAAGLSCSFGE